jgi:hypothetical protein
MFPTTTGDHHPSDAWRDGDAEDTAEEPTAEAVRGVPAREPEADLTSDIEHRTARTSRRRERSRRRRSWRRRLNRA